MTAYADQSGWLWRVGRVFLALVLDVAIVVGSYALALSLKFDGDVPPESWNQLIWAGPLIAFAYILSYQVLGVYRTAWQYGSIRDAILLALAVGIVTAGILTVNVLLPKRPLPLTVNVISAAFIFLFHAIARMAPRLWSSSGISIAADTQRQRVLIVGATDTGQRLAGELQTNRGAPYRAVAFVDDDPALRGKRVHGIPVAGVVNDLPLAIQKHDPDLVAIALPIEHTPALQEILDFVEPFKLPVRLVPGLSEVMEGRGGELRPITMEDLLAREAIDVDEIACRKAVEDRVVLIIGAAGSIGSELTRRVFSYGPASMHLIDTNETALHELRVEMNQLSGGKTPVKPWLANITDRQKLHDIFEAARPQVVFHLGAYKHIGMMEENPDQALETNVLGTLNVFEASQTVQAEKVVFLSSHTAVNPASVYGASKRLGELLAMSMPAGRTKFCAVRLVNVIDTRGTVLATFTRQIQAGGPISITDPEVARYFLTVNEVSSLVIQAAALCRGAELFLLDVGDEVRISDLAERMIRANGMEPGRDIVINYIGLRPGEKLREALTGEHETLLQTDHAKVLSAVSSRSFSGEELRTHIRELEVYRHRTPNLAKRLHDLARFDTAPVEAEEPEPAETTAPDP